MSAGLFEIHADGPNEHTLCGLAVDAFDSGDVDAPIRYAKRGAAVSCALCFAMIEHVYSNFSPTGRVKPGAPAPTPKEPTP